MTNRKEIDITELLFPLEPPTEKELEEQLIYQKATQEAYRIIGDSSPINLLRKTEEIYKKYLEERK